MTNGFHTPPTPTGNEPGYTSSNSGFSSWLNNGVTQRDYLTQQYQRVDTGGYRELYTVLNSASGQTVTQIVPSPLVRRVGGNSKPYRLLSGQEVQLSEDDLRVSGISKRYPISTIWQWGVLYLLNPYKDATGAIDVERSTLYELVYLEDSHPLYWVLNLRRRSDDRNKGFNYDIP